MELNLETDEEMRADEEEGEDERKLECTGRRGN